MEACLSAHFVSRALRKLGHEPRIIPAIYVKPFVKGQKNDYNDAEAIAKAALRPNLRTVEKSPGAARPAGPPPGALQVRVAPHCHFNQISTFLIEQGIAVRAGVTALRNSLFEIARQFSALAIWQNVCRSPAPRFTSVQTKTSLSAPVCPDKDEGIAWLDCEWFLASRSGDGEVKGHDDARSSCSSYVGPVVFLVSVPSKLKRLPRPHGRADGS